MISISYQRWLLAWLLPPLVGGCLAQNRDSRSPFTISLDVEQVVLHVTVQDRKGRHVRHLDKPAFEVYEEGERQEITYFSREDIPVTIGLVVDGSRSMRPKYNDVVAAALVFLQASNEDDEVFTVSFNEQVRFSLPSGMSFTDQFDKLTHALRQIRPDGQTALYDAIDLALGHIEDGRWDKHVLVVVSDGGDNASHTPLPEVLQRIERSTAIVYTIGLYDDANVDRDPGVLKKLSEMSGGKAYFPKQTKDVVGTCSTIAEDIRSQYTIGYKPADPAEPGVFRRVNVIPRSPDGRKLRARTRPGYYGPSRKMDH